MPTYWDCLASHMWSHTHLVSVLLQSEGMHEAMCIAMCTPNLEPRPLYQSSNASVCMPRIRREPVEKLAVHNSDFILNWITININYHFVCIHLLVFVAY